ncbi:Ig-like domain-containing protein, partial [Treponema berlinense]|uniref:Ig-like domain-containing protein n=1 Tax=Treponema berlinense TaxID=225004 RepID=UPI0023572E7D
MEKSVFNLSKGKEPLKVIRGGVFAIMLCALVCAAGSCKVGLGDSVDTEAPSVKIVYPDPNTNAIIRDTFILYGECDDDKQITAVKVTLVNTDTGETVLRDEPATVDSLSKHWRIDLNKYSLENRYAGWQLADGKYTATARAYDGSHDSSSDEKSSASSSFEIDNTPPVFVIKNPGVVKSGSNSPSAYGSIFTIEGTIAELHSVSSMDVTIYDESGSIVSKENYNGEEISSFREENIETAGGTSVIIAQAGSARYDGIYGDSSGTRKYTCSIRLTDNAKKYVAPPESADRRTAEEAAADEKGNSTSSLYLYDDVYETLLSQKKDTSKKLQPTDLMNILNGTKSDDEAKQILAGAKKNTSSAEESGRLYFSLNPNANPTYQVNGFEYKFGANATNQQASSGNAVSVTVTQGLDQTQIDLDGNEKSNATVKVWMKEYTADPESKEELAAELAETLAKKVRALEDDRDGYSDSTFTEYSKATDNLPATEIEGWKLIYDYGKNNSGGASVSTKTFSVTLPEGSIVLNKYYMLAVTGRDIDGVEFAQNTIYGFLGNEAGVPPTLRILSPGSSSLQAATGFSFSGSAVLTGGSLYTSYLRAALSVTDQDTNADLGTYTEEISRAGADKGWTSTAAFTCAEDGSWTFSPSGLKDYEKIKAEKYSGKSYLYTLELYGKSSSGHDSTVSSNVQIDTVLPVVSISSITPTVDGSEYDSSSNTYVNGTVTVKGAVEETNLESVVMQIFVDGSAVSYWTDNYGNPTDTLNLGKVYSFSQTIDTTNSKITDGKSLEIKVTATDKVGNQTTYSSLTDSSYRKLVVLQETDKPKISLNNASNSDEFKTDPKNISANNGNLFGTITNNKLTATVSDDDSIVSVNVTVYDKDGKPLSADEFNVNKSTYNLSYALPAEEGVYRICIDAYDYVETELSKNEYGKGTTGEFFIAVSAGAPVITLDSVKEYQPKNPTISGSVSSSGAKVSACFIDVKSNAVLETQPAVINVDNSSISSSKTWTSSLDKELLNGDYKILFTAENNYKESSTATAKFTVDDVAPTLTITQYGSNGGVTSNVDFHVIPTNEYTIKGTATDSVSGVESVLFKLGKIAENEEPSTANGWNVASISGEKWTAVVSSDMLSGLETKDGSTAYIFHVVAVDNAGNKTGNSDHDYISIYPDSELPAVGTLSATLGGGAVSNFNIESLNKTGDFVISSNISDNGGIASVSIQNNNESLSDKYSVANTNGKYSFTIDKSVVKDGSNTFSVKAKDKAGNENSSSITIQSDTTAPNVVISGISPTVTKENEEYVNGKITVTGIASDTLALAEKSLSIEVFDSTGVKQTAENLIASGDYSLSRTYKGWSFVLDTTKLAADNASYTIKVSAEDAAGNPSSVAERTIKVDQSTDTPVLTLTNADTSITTLDAINDGEKNIFGVSSNNVLKGTITDDDGIKTVKITLTPENEPATATTKELLTNGTSTSYSLNYALPSTEGGYTIEIFIEDTKGETKVSYINKSFALAVDSGAPSIKIETSNGGYYNGTSTPVNVVGTVSDGSGKITLSAVYSKDGENSATGNYSSEEGVSLSGGTASINDTINISSISDNTSDGYTTVYTAKDRWGQTSSATFKYYKDSVSPVFDNENSSVAGTSTIEKVLNSWFKDETLSVTAIFDESGSGVDTVYFWLDPSSSADAGVVSGDITKNSASATASNSNGKATVKTSISGFTESSTAHTLEVVAVDKAGNKSATQTYSIRIDSTAPEFASSYYTFDGVTFADASGSVLSNKEKNITVYGTVSDTASGVGEFESIKIAGANITDATVLFSVSNIPLSVSGSEISSLSFVPYSEIAEKTDIKSWKLIIPALSIKDGSVALTPTDTAGNGKGSLQKIFTFEVDTTAPSVGFTTPSVLDKVALSSVNGTSTITGKITEAKTPKSLEFYYSRNKSDNLSDYTKLGETITDASAIYTWSKEFDFNAFSAAENAVDSSGKYTGKASLYVLVAATDMAENANYEDGKITRSDGFVEIPVDLNGDVPTVKITNLTAKPDGSYWLVGGEDAKIEGTLSDDDGSIADFRIFETEITVDSDENPTILKAENAKLGWETGDSDFTYQPSITTDGEKKLYFYIKDAAGGIFYTGKNTNKQFTEPKIQVRSGTALPSDSAFAYTSDGTAPKVSSVKIACSNSKNGTYSEFETFTAGTIVGGTEKRYAKFQIEASDDIGIESGILTVGSSESETLTFTNADKNKIAVATSNVFDLAALLGGKLGYVNVSVVVKDKSGQSGNASSVFTLDNEGPATFNVTTPVLGTISTSDVTISGIAQDGSGAGIKSIEFAVPTKAQKEAGNVGTADENGASKVEKWSDVTFGGDLKEGATAGLWSFVFADGSNGGQLTQFTTVYDNNNAAYALEKEGSYLYKIPLWFKLTDTLGNEAVYEYLVYYNPNDNWPSATVVTPKNGAILGTNADFAGTAKDNKNVDAVYIQFDLNGDGVYDSKDITKFIDNNTGVTVYSKSALTFKDPSTEKEYSTLGLNLSEKGAIAANYTDWWGVKVSGETSWNGSFSLPETDSETKNWQVRACAVDDENIAGLWSDGSATNAAGSNSVKFRVDDAAPKIGLTTPHVSNSNGTKAYSSDMYVSSKSAGEWKLVVSLEDTDSGINIDKTTITVRLPSGSSVDVKDFEKKVTGNVTYKETNVTYHNYQIAIPLNLSSEGTVTYTIRTQDNSKAALSTSANYSFTVDNTAPKVGKVKFNSEELDMRKLYNTNRTAEISSAVEDSISGMASLNFFFERGGSYYVPFAGGSEGSWKMVSAEGKNFTPVDGIPAVTAKGTGSAKGNTFTISNTTNTDFVSAGGIIKIGGSYYNITEVKDNTVTFDGTLAATVEEAIFPYALSVNYKTTVTESGNWTGANYSVSSDDGDGLIETVSKSGGTWNCTAALLSDSIADGTIVLHAVAIDAAGNVSKDVTTRTMISNHAPRLAKVHLATDLNGDGTYSTSETDAFSALDENGKTQEVVTLATDIYDFNSKIPANTNGKTNAKAYFKVTGDLVVAPEFVGGHEGQGTVSYDAVIGSKLEPTWKLSGSLHGALANSNDKVADITAGTTEGRENALKYLTLSASDMKTHFDREDKTDTIALSFWDSSEVYGFTGDKNSGYKADGNKIAEGTASKLADSSSTLYSNFGYQWTIANIPVYFDITDGVPPEGTIKPFYWKKAGSSEGKVNDGSNSIYYSVTGESPDYSYKPFGHIELGDTPEVSGTVVLTGEVSDDQLMKTVTVEFTLGDKKTTISASYNKSEKTWKTEPEGKTVTEDGYELIMSNDELTQAEHSADWTLYLDTAKLGNAETKTVTVTVTQAKSAAESANNTSTPASYAMKVVPYITGIERSSTKNSTTTMNRSTYGEYPVAVG